MSTGIGTLELRTRAGHLVWPAIVAAVIILVAIGSIAIGIDWNIAREGSRSIPGGVTKGGYVPQTGVTTPSELSGVATSTSVEGTLANTPTEMRGGMVVVPRIGYADANTPTELRGGLVATRGAGAALSGYTQALRDRTAS